MLNFIHIADLHANRERKDGCLKVLSQIKSLITSKEQSPKLLIAGDFWDSVITNTEVFAEYVAAVKQLIDITEVIFISGTPSHEPAGSLKIFKELGAKVIESNSFIDFDDFELIAIPEPRRAEYNNNSDKDLDSQINENLNSFIASLPQKKKPRILMYHGEVVGSVYDSGIAASSKIAISPATLKSTDSDYYALGHIHLPQSPFENAYYSGSSFPKGFGEAHIGSFKYVEITDETKVETVECGFPQNITESVKFEDIDSIKKKDYTNKRVHLKIEMDKLFKKSFNSEIIKKELLDSTHAEYIKFSFNYTTTSNIRSEKVSQTKSAVDKFKIYADINDIKYNDSLINRLQDIEDNLLIEQFTPSDSFELESLSLRGAIGIKDGTGLDEYNIDFTSYDDGILAIIGNCGSGKTTILENCHPYPQMLTRSGSLKDHFCLKDSHRILVYKTPSGKKYKIKMIIDGAAKCVMNKYFVEVKEPGSESWSPMMSINGNFEAYKEWVFHTFGSIEMFMRTSFYAKEQVKSVPDLSRATKTEKMDFFASLSGLDYLSIISDTAKEKTTEETKVIEDLKSSIKDFDKVKNDIETLEANAINNKAELDKYNELIKIDNEELAIYKKEQEKYIAVASSLTMLQENLKTKTKLEEALHQQFISLQDDCNELKEMLDNKELYTQQRAWVKEHSDKKAQLKSRISTLNDDIFQKKVKAMDIDRIVSGLNNDKVELDRKFNKLTLQIEMKQKSIPELNGLCPVCGSPLSEHKKEELEKEISLINKEIKSFEKELKQVTEDINAVESKLSIMDAEGVRKEIIDSENEIFDINKDIEAIDGYMSTLDLDKIEYVCTSAEKDYQEKLFEKKEVSVNLENARSELEELKKATKEQPVDYSDKIKRLERGILDSTKRAGELEAEVNIALKQLDSLKKTRDEINTIEEKIKSHTIAIKDYSIIEKAFSNKGIQCLELDSAAPEISDITNSILRETYGDRFTLSFETQRNTKDGRTIDDFIINVFDSQSGRIKKLDVLSSGESVWIKQALYYAFSVLRARRTGFCFRTRFLDESDGSLDSEARIKYIQMIRAAHKACNARLTIMITHSQEIKDVVDQKLSLGRGE